MEQKALVESTFNRDKPLDKQNMTTEVKVAPMGEFIISGILADWNVKDIYVVSVSHVLHKLDPDKITSGEPSSSSQ